MARPSLHLEIVEQRNVAQNDLYVWLTDVVLKGEPSDDVRKVFEKFIDIECHSPQDIIDAEITKTELKEDMKIPFKYCSRIMKSLKSFSGSLSVSPHPMSSPSAASVKRFSFKSSSPTSSYFCGSHPIHVNVNESDSTESDLLKGFVEVTDSMTDEKHIRLVVVKLPGPGHDLEREKRILKNLNEKDFCSAIQMYSSPGAYLVMEQYDDDLRYVLDPEIDVEYRKLMIPQVVSAVLFLHRHEVAHCDLKPANILLKKHPTGFGWKIAICDFDSAVDLSSSDTEFANNGNNLKYSPGWVSPEVYNGKVGMKASTETDLFHLGLLIEVLTRKSCHANTTVLPCDPTELNLLYNPSSGNIEEAFHQLLTSTGVYAASVKELCSLNPKKRGNIEHWYKACSMTKTDFLEGALKVEEALIEKKQENEFLKDDLRNEMGKIREDISKLHDVFAKFESSSNEMMVELKESLVTTNENNQIIMDKNFEGLRAALQVESSGVSRLLAVENERALTLSDLQNLSHDLMSSFKQCSEHMSSAAKCSMQSVYSDLRDVLVSTINNGQEASHVEIVAVLKSYEKQLDSLKQSSDEIHSCISIVRDSQREVVDTTRDLLLGGQDNILQVVSKFSENLTSLSSENSSHMLGELKKMGDRDSQLKEFVGDIAEMLEDMLSSTEQNEAQSMLLLTGIGNQLKEVTRQVEAVQSKVDKLPDQINADMGVLMAVHSSTLLERMQTVHDRLVFNVEEVQKARKGSDLNLCIRGVEHELKSWLSATITEANQQSNEAVIEAVHTQHKLTTKTLLELQHFQESSAQCNRHELKELKANVFDKFQEMQSKLSTVLCKVENCEQTCTTLVQDIKKLTMQSRIDSHKTEELLDSLKQSAMETITVLDSFQGTMRQDGGSDIDNISVALNSLQTQFSEHLERQHVAEELQLSIRRALEDIRKQQNESEADNRVSIAATKEQLDVVLSTLESSQKELFFLRKMSESHHQLLTIMENRGNLLPTKFIIIPEVEQISSTNIFKKMKEKVCKVMWNRVKLYFVCDISDKCAFNGGPQQSGYELTIPTKTLKILLPILSLSVSVLKTVMQIQGIPVGLLPSLPNLPNLPENVFVDSIMNSIPSRDGITDKIDEISNDKSHFEDEGHLAAIQEGQVDALFRLIQKSEGCEGQPLVGWEPKFTGLKKVSVTTGARGPSKWVLSDYANIYEEHGEDAREMIIKSRECEEDV